MGDCRTRLAPSPTGALHLGNARTFAINWAMARQRGWAVVLRIEDLDGPRVKPGADRQAIDLLRWLGLDWDEGPRYQRHDLRRYHAALDHLASRGLIYPCRCTRKEIAKALSAPHDDAHETRYPGTCRPADPQPVRYAPEAAGEPAWRIRVADETIAFDDSFAGPQRINVLRTVGDFVVSTRLGLPAYQLAVVIDDAEQRINHVVRGDDLLGSTARQLILYRDLGIAPAPTYTHLPLVIGEDGRRLAKRHGDTRLGYYRDHGVRPQRILGLLGEWCGLGPRRELDTDTFVETFDLGRLPREPIVFTPEDDRWLMGR